MATKKTFAQSLKTLLDAFDVIKAKHGEEKAIEMLATVFSWKAGGK